MGDEITFGVVSIIVILVLFCYAFGGSFFEAKHFHIIHETGLGIILGIIVGLLCYYLFPEHLNDLTDFNQQIFFYLLLPIIIFSGGYNLNKRRFFQNFFYICIFGIFGTIISFFITTYLTYLVSENGLIKVAGGNEVVKFNIYQTMIFSATVSATDSVAALTMIKADKYPKLFSVVFGEGMINDAVAIIIFLSIKNLTNATGSNIDFKWYTTFTILGQFFYEFICSTLIGALVGILTTLLFKTFRFLTHSCVVECIIILYMGYVSFQVCQIVELSGVISALICGVVLAHYNFYNMSPLGKVSSQALISSISMICEAFIYVYLGVSIWELKKTEHTKGNEFSWTFTLIETGICFFSRAMMLIILGSITILIRGKSKWRLSFSEVSIIWFAGLIRGSVAFALIQELESPNEEQELAVEIAKTTVLLMVIATTIILGGLMPFYIVFNLRHSDGRRSVPNDSFRETMKQTLMGDLNDLGEGEPEASKNLRTKFQRMVRKFDDAVLKPILVYQFGARRDEIDHRKRSMMKNSFLDPVRFTVKSQGYGHLQDNQESILGKRESKVLYTRVTLKSTINTKFAGMQELNFDLDIPLDPHLFKEDQLSQIKSELNDSEHDEKEEAKEQS